MKPSSHLNIETFKYSGFSTIPLFGFTESNFIDVKDFEWEIRYKYHMASIFYNYISPLNITATTPYTTIKFTRTKITS